MKRLLMGLVLCSIGTLSYGQHIVSAEPDIFTQEYTVQINSSKKPKLAKTDAISTNFNHPNIFVSTVIRMDNQDKIHTDFVLQISPTYAYYLSYPQVVFTLGDQRELTLNFRTISAKNSTIFYHYTLTPQDIALLEKQPIIRMTFNPLEKGYVSHYFNIKEKSQRSIQGTLALTAQQVNVLSTL